MSVANIQQNYNHLKDFRVNDDSLNVRQEVLRHLEPHFNLTFFGVDSLQQLFDREHKKRFLVDRPKVFGRRRKRDKKGDAVMYMNLEGGGGGEACPSIADSSAVSLSQMAFLSMTVSVFSVVASIANNLNNNNNNNNDNNINFIQQKQNNLNMNQNIVNQINIDLPPPVPGKRSISDVTLNSKIRKMVQAKKSQWKKNKSKKCSSTDLSPEAADAMVTILKSSMSNNKILDTPHTRECLGRELCLRSTTNNIAVAESPVQKVFYMLESFALLFIELDDKTESFGEFLERMTRGSMTSSGGDPGTSPGGDLNETDCFNLFPGCGEPDVYTLASM